MPGAFEYGNRRPGADQDPDEDKKMPAWQKFSAGGAGLGSLLGGDAGAAIGGFLPLLLQFLGKGGAMEGLAGRLGEKLGAIGEDREQPGTPAPDPAAAAPAPQQDPITAINQMNQNGAMMAPNRDPLEALRAMMGAGAR